MTAVSKNLYINKLDEIVDKYNKTYIAIKRKPADVQPLNIMTKALNSNLVAM